MHPFGDQVGDRRGVPNPPVVAERLGQHFDTYVLDVRGRGLSSTGPELDYDTDTCADDVIAFIDALGLSNVILAGHSMGARFALRAMSRGADLFEKGLRLGTGQCNVKRYNAPTSAT